MTVSANDALTLFEGDGTSVNFNYDFPCSDANDIVVFLDGIETAAFSVNLTTQLVTLNSAAANGVKGAIVRKTTITQLVEYSRVNNSLNLKALADQLDAIVKHQQETTREAANAIKGDYTNPAPRIVGPWTSGEVPVIDANGNLSAEAGVTGAKIGDAEQFATEAEAARDAAQTAQTGAETAETNAAASASAAETAQAGAETAEQNLLNAIGTTVQAHSADLDRITSGAWGELSSTDALKASLGLVKSDVGLGNVDNVSAASLRDRSTHTGSQAISTVTGLQTALDGKVPTTRTVAGKALSSNITLVKGDVGLGSVDNTSDADKPVSTAQQTALDGKMEVNAHGLGTGTTIPPNNDLNDVTETNFNYADSAILNRPGGAGNWVVLTLRRTADIRAQVAFSRASNDIQFRYNNGAGWQPWVAVISGGSGSNDAIVTSMAALRALDTATLSVAIYDGDVWNLVATSGVSSLVSADTQRGVYAESTDDTAFTWVRQHNGVITPEMFGATTVTDFASPSDSTTALKGMVFLVNALSLPVEIRLRGYYMTTEHLGIVTEAFCMKGIGAADSGLIFDPPTHQRLMGLTQSTMQSTVVIEDVGFLVNSDNQKIAFDYNNTRTGGVPGNAFKKEITRCIFMGLYRFRKLRHGAGAGDDQGWLQEVKITEGDGFYMKRCLIEGNENDRTVGAFFPNNTIGVDVHDSTHFVMEDCGVNFKADGVKGTGSMEALEMTRNHLVLNRRGVTLASTSAPANDHNFHQNHINSFEYNMDLYYGSTIAPRMFTIQGNLFFATAAGSAGQAGDTQGFRHIRGDFASSQIFGNYAYTEAGVDPTSGARDHRFLLLGGGDYNMAFGNTVEHIQTIFELEAGTVGTMIFGNTAWDNPAGSSGTIATTDAAILDNGSDNYQWFNGGVRKGGWGAPRLPIQQLAGHADDAAASSGGVPIGGLYRTGSTLKIRVT